MSRLYETLERINRAQEQQKGGQEGGYGKTLGPLVCPQGVHRRTTRLWLTATLLTLAFIVGLYTVLRLTNPTILTRSVHGILSTSNDTSGTDGPRQKVTKQVKSGVQQPLPMKTARRKEGGVDPVALNNQAVRLLKKGAYWEALYLLDEAIQRAPQLEAPYDNMVYGLVQLGYYGAAQEYCEEIRRLFGDTEWLKRNQDALVGIGIEIGPGGRAPAEASGA